MYATPNVRTPAPFTNLKAGTAIIASSSTALTQQTAGPVLCLRQNSRIARAATAGRFALTSEMPTSTPTL